MKVGVLDSVIGGRDDLDRFERARSIDCAGIEVMLLRTHLRGTEKPGSLRAAQAATGLEIPTFVLDEHNFGGIASPDASVAAAAADDVRTAIAWAAELGVGAVLIPFFVEAELRDDAAFERAVAAFRALCPLAVERGVVLAYEGTLPAARVRALAERVGSPGFGCYFDLANLVVRGLDPPTEIRQLGDLICRVHVKDLRARKNDCHPGLGRVDFPECAAALAGIGYDGWLVLETPAAPLPVVARDVAFTCAAFAIPRDERPVYGAFAGDHATWPELADGFDDLGLRAVQLGGPLLNRCLADDAFTAEGREALESRGLRIAALSGYRNLVADEPDLTHVRRCLELAPALGTWVVATGAGTRSAEHDWADDPDNWSKESWQRLEDAVAQLVPAAEASGAVLALEGTWMTVLRTLSQVIDLLERHPSPNLQLVCDPYNFVSYELLPARDRILDEYLELFESRFVLAHLKDVGVDGGKTTRPEFGTGIFDHAPYLEFLRTQRPDLPLVFEHLPLDHVPSAVARVEAYIT
jgi:sugar phosphate isomerase/epimerase